MSKTPVADAIRAMQDRLGRPEWWTRGAYRRADGSACLEGAIEEVAPFRLRNRIERFLREVGDAWRSDWWSGYGPLFVLNDELLADHDELLLFLDAALDVAEAEGI